MFSAGDEELMTFSGVYDQVHFGATEGSVWSGNIWTQNTYGAGFASLPFLPQPQLQWLQTRPPNGPRPGGRGWCHACP